MRILRRTRRTYERERQQVRFQACQPTDAQILADIEHNKRVAAKLKADAQKRINRENT